MATPDIYITPSHGTIGLTGSVEGTIQLRVAESGAVHFEGDQGSLLTITDDLSDSLFSVNDAAGMPVFEVFADDTIKSYRNNETKFEIDPDNNRIRLRDNAYISGDLVVSGDITASSATHESTSYTASSLLRAPQLGIAESTSTLGSPIAAVPWPPTPSTLPHIVIEGINGAAQAGGLYFTEGGHTAAYGLSGYGVALEYISAAPDRLEIVGYHGGSGPTAREQLMSFSRTNKGVGIGTTPQAGSLLAIGVGDVGITGELRVNDGIYVSDGASAGDAYIQLGNSNDYANFTSAQFHMAGGTNAGFQAGGKRKIFLSDYDNDATDGVILFQCIDENQNQDIKLAGYGSTTGDAVNYFRGQLGVGVMPDQTRPAKLHVKVDNAETDLTMGRIGDIEIQNTNATAGSFAGLSLRSNSFDSAITAVTDGTSNGGYLSFHTDHGGGAYGESMSINTAGEVLIGEGHGQKGALLTVSGDVGITGAA